MPADWKNKQKNNVHGWNRSTKMTHIPYRGWRALTRVKAMSKGKCRTFKNYSPWMFQTTLVYPRGSRPWTCTQTSCLLHTQSWLHPGEQQTLIGRGWGREGNACAIVYACVIVWAYVHVCKSMCVCVYVHECMCVWDQMLMSVGLCNPGGSYE